MLPALAVPGMLPICDSSHGVLYNGYRRWFVVEYEELFVALIMIWFVNCALPARYCSPAVPSAARWTSSVTLSASLLLRTCAVADWNTECVPFLAYTPASHSYVLSFPGCSTSIYI